VLILKFSPIDLDLGWKRGNDAEKVIKSVSNREGSEVKELLINRDIRGNSKHLGLPLI